MGCAGNPIVYTPNMDRLAGEGVRFANAFVTTSICAASRASFFTGLHERTHQLTFGTPPLRSEFVAMSYPVLLREAGYRTGFVGKFGVGMGRTDRNRMFDVCRPLGRSPYLKKQPDGSLRHVTDLAGDEAIDFLRSCKRDRPFCLSVSFNAPHAEDKDPKQYIWPQSVDHLYRSVTIPTPKTADPAFFESQPEFLKQSLSRTRWHWRFETSEKAQNMTKGYYRMISGVDAVIGRILAELERLKLRENTVIIFSSDNGYFLGERGFAGKWLMYEESIRVPLIVSYPGMRKERHGVCVEQMALNVDVAPTILGLAGVDVPAKMQGRSLAPLLKGEKTPWRSDFFYEHLFKTKRIPKTEGVRTERWKYIRYFQQQPAHEELYDLAIDSHEERNLADDRRHQERLASLRKRCDELRDQYGGPYVRRPRKRAERPAPPGFVEGIKGGAALFDGKASYVPAGRIPAIAKDDDFSWSFWVCVEPRSRKSGVIVGNRRLGKRDTLQFMKVTPTTVQYYNTRQQPIRMSHRIPAKKWTHVAVVKNGRKLSCYTDGRLVTSADVRLDMPALPFYLGGDPHAREFAACRLDEVRIYRRALTASDVEALTALNDIDDGLAGYWPLDKVTDAKGNTARGE